MTQETKHNLLQFPSRSLVKSRFITHARNVWVACMLKQQFHQLKLTTGTSFPIDGFVLEKITEDKGNYNSINSIT